MIKLLLPLLLLTGCTSREFTDFSIGDCIVSTAYRESWEKPHTTYKIVRVGKEKYTLAYYTTNYNLNRILTIDFYKSWETDSKKVECPSNLKNYKL